MNGIDILTLAIAKSYTDETVVGGGAIKGKNCTISDISPITGGNRITFQWTLDDGTVKTDTLDVMDGEDGATPTIAISEITGGHRVTVTIDGTSESFDVMDGEKGDKGDKGDDAQKSSLPTASASEVGKIYQYVGETTATLINGYFYQCVEDSGSYSWVAKNVQQGGGSGTSDYTELTNKPQIGGVTLVGNKTASDLGLVEAESGKGLSENDYTDADKAIVDGVSTALDGKVDKVTGKGLSKNDYTDADKAKVDALGTASEKDVTTYVNPGNLDMPNSNAVYQAMTSMLEGAFHPKGNKTVAELTSDLLVQANVGSVYKITDSGVTDANWVGGAGQTITANQMAVVVYGNEPNTFLFNLEDGINIDMSAYQTKAITPIEVDGVTKSNVEDAVDAINVLAGSNKSDISGIKDGQGIDSFGDVETALDDKADKVASATNGNFAGLDANGNLTDSGKKASDFGTADEIADIVNVYGAKNLIPYPYLNESGIEFRGVTYTVNADRSVTANGTATGGDSAFFILQRNVDNDFLSRIGQGNFILSGCPAGGSLQTYYLNFNYGDAQSSVGNLGQDTGNGKEIIIDTDITQYNAQITVLIREGVTVSNLTFKPMLRMASVKDNTYVPYVPTNKELAGGKADKSDVDDIAQSLIDYEVVDVKNMLDPKWFNNASGCTVTTFYDKDKVTKYVLTGTTTGGNGVQFARRVAKDLTLPVGESYVFSVSATLPFGVLEVGYTHPTTGAWTVVKSQATDVLEFTVPAEADGMPWTIQYVPGGSDRTFDNLSIYPMLCTDEEWAKSHNYEPFYIPVKDAMFRRSEQRVLGAKNLIPYPYYRSSGYETNGITFTVNADGSVTANGTATDYANFSCTARDVDWNLQVNVGDRYILSGSPEGSDSSNYWMAMNCKQNNSTNTFLYVYEDEKEFVLPASDTYYGIILTIKGGVTVSNLTFKPMLRLASDPDSTYVPYAPTNAKLNEEKMSYADNGVLGAKNLLEVVPNTQTFNGVTFTVNADKSVTVNGTATANTNFRLIPYSNIDLSLWTGKPLRLSGCPSGGSNSTYAMEIYYNDGEQHWLRDFGDGVELSIPISGLTSLNPNIMVKNGVTVNNLVFKPMVRLASDPDSTYQPYAMTNRELTEKVNVLPREIFVTTDTRTTTTNDANTLPCGFTRMSDANSNLPTDGTGGNVWYDILTVRQSNDSSKETWGYGFQLAVQTTTNANMGDMYVRAVNGGATPAWGAWRKLN